MNFDACWINRADFYFLQRRPDVKEHSEEHKKLAKEYVQGAKNAVHSSIEAMRRMTTAGELD